MKQDYISIFILSILLTSCGYQEKKLASFSYIDLTYNNGWGGVTYVHLDSNGLAKVRLDKRNKPVSFFQDNLDATLFTKIDSLAECVLKMQHDTVSGYFVPDCGGCYIIIKSKLKQIETMSWAGIPCCDEMHKLTRNVIDVSDTIKKPFADTSFKFKSFWRLPPSRHLTIDMNPFGTPPIPDK